MDLLQPHEHTLAQRSPIYERFLRLKARIEKRLDDIANLHRTIIERLLSWDEEIEGVHLQSGDFISDGLPIVLESILKSESELSDLRIGSFADVTVPRDTEKRCKIGTINIPHSDPIAEGDWLNSTLLRSFPQVAFEPYLSLGRADMAKATYESNGPFLLTAEQAGAARVEIAVSALGDYLYIAHDIHTHEYGRGEAVYQNMQWAEAACRWLEEYLS